MPWSVHKNHPRCSGSKRWAVVKESDGTLVGCHTSRALALQQIAALNAQVKERAMSDTRDNDGPAEEGDTEEKAMLALADTGDISVPIAVTTFTDLDALEDAREIGVGMRRLTAQFAEMAENIFYNEEVADKAAALQSLAGEFAGRVGDVARGEETKEVTPSTPQPSIGDGKSAGLIERLTETVKSWFGSDEVPAPASSGLIVWKEAGGRYRWLATFSNKYRDQDRPPEILAETAHKEFVGAVDGGEWPMPELRHWHVPGSRWGEADWVAYDEATGFALASGLVDEGHEKEAQAVAAMDRVLVSHGMPLAEIERDEKDATIITRYRSIEISDLPEWAAANPLTGFSILSKEANDMPIPDEKKAYLQQTGLTEEQIAQIEADLEGKAKEAGETGLEFKEEGEPGAEATEAAPAPAGDEAGGDEGAMPALTAEAVADAIVAAVKPLQDQLAALAATVKELSLSDEEKVVAKAAATPAASLADLVRQRAVGAPETKLDGRTGLAKSGPQEAPVPEALAVSSVPWINQMLGIGDQPQ